MPFCSSCGTPLAGDAIAGQCPRCLLGLGLEASAPASGSGERAGPGNPAPEARGVSGSRPPFPPRALEAGSRLGAYHVLSLLGRGGMGEVYRARDSRLGREVAVKLLPLELGGRPEMLARFEREARMLASLNHPNVATLYGFETAGDNHFLVMELIEGETLADRLERGPIGQAEALPIFLDVARGLAAAHEKGVVHRDLKPSNVEISDHGPVKVLDFGLAKAAANPQSPVGSRSVSPTLPLDATQAGMVLGTAAYMSPEQAKGREVDRRTDVWSFGCCLYEALTGIRAFDGDSLTEILANVLKEDPDWARVEASSSPGVVRLLRRCLVKDPARRLRDLGDGALEIEELIDASAVPAARELAAAPAAGGVRRALGIGIAAAALALGLLLGWGVPRLGAPDAAEPPRPLRRFSVAMGEASGGIHSLAVSPEGRFLAVAQNETSAPLLLQRLDRPGWEPIAGTEGGEFPFFSPDGRSIGFFTSRENHLKKVPVDGGRAVVLAEGLVRNWGGSWSDDGWVVFHSQTGGDGLSRIREGGGAVEVLTRPDREAGEESHRWPQVLPGGRLILFTIWSGSGEGSHVALYDTADGSVRRLVPGLYGRRLRGGRLAFFAGSQCMLAPFDDRSGRLLGPASPVEGLHVTGPWGHRAVAWTEDGLMVRAEPSIGRPVWVDRSGRRQEIELMPPGVYQTPALSRGGDRIAVAVAEEGKSSDIWIYDLVGGRRSRLTLDGENASPLWVDDDRAIVFWSERAGVRTLYKRPVDGGREAEPLLDTAHGRPITLTPDGRWIATNHASDIWLVPVDGAGEPRLLLRTEFLEGNPSFSPDGEWYAYLSDEAGRFEVYVRPVDGSSGRLVVSRGNSDDAVWSPAGDEIVYRSEGRFLSAPVEASAGGAGIRIGTPTPLFADRYLLSTGRNMDVSPDGERFLMIEEVEPARLVFLEHWFESVGR